jgi:hypothetical protein
LRVEKIINIFLIRDFWNFSFFGQSDVIPTHSKLCRFVSGSQAKHEVSSPLISLLTKSFVCIGHSDNVLARCALIFLLLTFQAVWNKTCTQLSLFQISFQNTKNVTCYNQMIVAIVDVLTSFIFIFTNDNR